MDAEDAQARHLEANHETEPTNDEAEGAQTEETTGHEEVRQEEVLPPPSLPEIPLSSDIGFDLSSIIGSSSSNEEETSRYMKRQSNVQKLAEENEKLKYELKMMSDRLEAAEARRKALAQKEQHTMEHPSS